MKGEICIKNLIVRSRIGITEAERAFPQDLKININLSSDPGAAIASDNIDDTVDYFSLHQQIVHVCEISSFNLLESLADKIAKVCLSSQHVSSVNVTIEKPNILSGAESAGHKLTVTNEKYKNSDSSNTEHLS